MSHTYWANRTPLEWLSRARRGPRQGLRVAPWGALRGREAVRTARELRRQAQRLEAADA